MSDNEALRITCLEPGCVFFVASSRGDDAEYLAGLMDAHHRVLHPVIPPVSAADLSEDYLYFTHGQELWVFRGTQGWDRVVFVGADPGSEDFSVVTHEGEPMLVQTELLKLSPPLEDEPRLATPVHDSVTDDAGITLGTFRHLTSALPEATVIRVFHPLDEQRPATLLSVSFDPPEATVEIS